MRTIIVSLCSLIALVACSSNDASTGGTSPGGAHAGGSSGGGAIAQGGGGGHGGTAQGGTSPGGASQGGASQGGASQGGAPQGGGGAMPGSCGNVPPPVGVCQSGAMAIASSAGVGGSPSIQCASSCKDADANEYAVVCDGSSCSCNYHAASGRPSACAEVAYCAHDVCTEGAPLDPACDPCVALVCEPGHDPFCCGATGGTWDAQCLVEVQAGYGCGLTCPLACDCGNGQCQAGCGEDASTCTQDCGHPCVCGNGVCQPACGETPVTCPADCTYPCTDTVCTCTLAGDCTSGHCCPAPWE